MTYLEGADVFVRVVSLPYGIDSQVVPNDDGTFSLYLNSRADSLSQMDNYLHEFQHIENDDFYNDKGITEIEK